MPVLRCFVFMPIQSGLVLDIRPEEADVTPEQIEAWGKFAVLVGSGIFIAAFGFVIAYIAWRDWK
ncbi:Uncharacterised protein [Mycobacteroides abscessus subsp. abscessus]|nr:Uncharacterised protein [Mycobacteroides abscessus subsp. abscessus]